MDKVGQVGGEEDHEEQLNVLWEGGVVRGGLHLMPCCLRGIQFVVTAARQVEKEVVLNLVRRWLLWQEVGAKLAQMPADTQVWAVAASPVVDRRGTLAYDAPP